ncbi:hypothetical protein ACHAXH_001043 [Discostella pseudostelligera]
MAPLLRSYDAFAKPIDSIRERSLSGGFITLLASITAALLFLSQIIVYLQGQTRHSMILAESTPSLLFNNDAAAATVISSKKKLAIAAASDHHIPMRVHVTFPHLNCNAIDYSQDGNSLSSGSFMHYHVAPFTLVKRKPTLSEYKKSAFKYSSDATIIIDKKRLEEGCTIIGTIQIPRVGSVLSISVSPEAWRRATSMISFGVDLSSGNTDPFHGRLPNVTHYIHDVTFGAPFPPGSNPLQNAHHVMDNGSGVALANVMVKLVPTTYQRTFHAAQETYQASITRHIVQPETLASQQSTLLPGLLITYDFTPLAVRHVESRENWLVFVSSLLGIVGGVFVTVSLVSGFVVNSAQAVAKKMD